MNFRTTIILLILVLIGGGVWLFTSRSQPETSENELETPPTSETKYVFDPQPQPDDIVRLQVERADCPRLVFTRAPQDDDPTKLGDWQMIEPLAVATEDYMVTSLTGTFTRLVTRSRFEPGSAGGVTAQQAGLEPPFATVSLVDKTGKEYKLEVGNKAAMSDDTYVRVAGQKQIHVASRDLAPELKKEVKEFRSKNLIKLTAADAVHCKIKHDGKTFDLTRGANQEWVFNAPVKTFAEAAKVITLLGKFNSLRVVEFVDDAPESLASYGFDPPYLTATVTTETQREIPRPADEEPTTQPAEPQYETVATTHGVSVGGFADLKSKHRYVMLAGQPWVVTVTDANVGGLLPKLVELRDPRVTRVAATAAQQLETSGGGVTATLTKADGRWQGTGDLAELEVAAVADLLDAFEDIKALDFVDQPEAPAKYGLDQPRAVIKVTVAGEVTPVTLKVGANTASGRNTYVQVEGRPTVFVISAKQADRLAVTPLSLRSRAVFSSKPEDIKRLDVRHGQSHFVLGRLGASWTMSEPAGAPVDPAGVRELTNDLSRLRGKRVVAKGADEQYGLSQPAVTVSFAVQQQPAAPPSTQPAATEPVLVEHTLRIGRQDNVAYCRKDDDPYIFELDETVYQVMVAELIDRALFDFKADDIARVSVVATGGTNDLVNEDGDWKYAPDPYLKLSQTKVKEFIGMVAGLRAERYLTFSGGDLAAAGLEQAPAKVTIRLQDEREITLHLNQQRPGELPLKAAWVQEQRIFLLRQADVEKLLSSVDSYLLPETPETPPQPGPGRP